MDEPGLDSSLHREALHGLARLNRWSRAAAILWPEIESFAATHHKTHLRLLDLASGGGDNAAQLWLHARRRGLHLEITGWDISPDALAHAKMFGVRASARTLENTNPALQSDGIVFEQHDALADPIPPGFDIIMSSLFLHHLDNSRALALLRRMREATGGLVLINDLRRSLAGLALAHAAAHLLTGSAVVRNDAPASVRGAYTTDEVRGLARQAGLQGAIVENRWPFRFLLRWPAV